MSEPSTAAGRALLEHLDEAGRLSSDISFPDAEDRIAAIENEARAAAERDVAALRVALDAEPPLSDWPSEDYRTGWNRAIAYVRTLIADVLGVAVKVSAAAAEPRWPSGPEAERELAAALPGPGYGLYGDAGSSPDNRATVARAILAALQEKRDPGE